MGSDQELRSLATTISLARSLEVSPGGLPAHRCLRRCSLADRARSGRDVLCQTSELGLAFLDVAAI